MRQHPAFVRVAASALLAAASVAASTVSRADPNPPAWLSYDRPATYDAISQLQIQVPMRDGSYLNCDLVRPGLNGVAISGAVPGVIYQYHGYNFNRTEGQDPAQRTLLAQRGYAVLQCNVRGTGGSPGQVDPFAPLEAQDNYDMVEWLAAQPWSTGKIAQIGYSWGAITCYRVAALLPPHLVTIVPQASYADLYDDIVFMGGARGLDIRVWMLGLIAALNATPGTPPDQEAAIVARTPVLDATWGAHTTYDSYWADRSIDHDAVRKSRIPILAFGGWYDIYQRGMPLNYQLLRGQTWLVMGSNSHIEETGPSYFGTAGGGVLAWLDHWLLGSKSAPFPTAKVTTWEMPRDTGTGWTQFSDWPPQGAQPTRMYFNPSGTLAPTPEPPGVVVYPIDPTDGEPTFWNVGVRNDTTGVPQEQEVHEASRAHFRTGVLAQDVVLTGSIVVHLVASIDSADTDFAVRLFDVAPDGSKTLVASGWLKGSHRNSDEAPSPVIPNVPTVFPVEIWPSHWRFFAGHQLEISVSGGDLPRIMPESTPGIATILAGQYGSYADIPLLTQ